MPHNDKFLLTVPGVNSINDGFAALRTRCETTLPGIKVDSFFFGRVLPFKELTDSVRQFIYRTLRDRLQIITDTYLVPEKRRCYIVAHSFGTLAAVRALEMHVRDLNVDGLILLGSIVPRDYYWDGLVSSGRLSGPPVAVIRPFDLIVRRAHLISGGSSGSDGFIPTGVHRALESFKNGGHTAYDPDDASDVIVGIEHGLTAIPKKDRLIWLGEQTLLKRLSLAAIRKIF